MFALKPLSHASIEAALAKAEHYRFLKESAESESICRDILEVESGNQRALICLVLALSDQIGQDSHAFQQGLKIASRLQGEYERAYYEGILWERRAKARLHEGSRGVSHSVYEWTVHALKLFEKAEHLRPPGNDDARLRWNTCVRFLARHKELAPRGEEVVEPILSE
jgi:hypothetical protein